MTNRRHLAQDIVNKIKNGNLSNEKERSSVCNQLRSAGIVPHMHVVANRGQQLLNMLNWSSDKYIEYILGQILYVLLNPTRKFDKELAYHRKNLLTHCK